MKSILIVYLIKILFYFYWFLTKVLTSPIIYNEPALIIISLSLIFSNEYSTASCILGLHITYLLYKLTLLANSSASIALGLFDVVVIILLNLVIPTNLSGRLIQIPILLLYGLVSFGVYLVIHYFNGNLKVFIHK